MAIVRDILGATRCQMEAGLRKAGLKGSGSGSDAMDSPCGEMGSRAGGVASNNPKLKQLMKERGNTGAAACNPVKT